MTSGGCEGKRQHMSGNFASSGLEGILIPVESEMVWGRLCTVLLLFLFLMCCSWVRIPIKPLLVRGAKS